MRHHDEGSYEAPTVMRAKSNTEHLEQAFGVFHRNWHYWIAGFMFAFPLLCSFIPQPIGFAGQENPFGGIIQRIIAGSIAGGLVFFTLSGIRMSAKALGQGDKNSPGFLIGAAFGIALFIFISSGLLDLQGKLPSQEQTRTKLQALTDIGPSGIIRLLTFLFIGGVIGQRCLDPFLTPKSKQPHNPDFQTSHSETSQYSQTSGNDGQYATSHVWYTTAVEDYFELPVKGKKSKIPLPIKIILFPFCLLYTSPSPRDQRGSRMPSSA